MGDHIDGIRQSIAEISLSLQLMAKEQKMDRLEKNAVKAEALFWAEERTRAPIRVAPDISPYTR